MLGQDPLTDSFAQTAALFIEGLGRTSSPLLISSQDDTAVLLSKHLSHTLGREAVLDYSWDAEEKRPKTESRLRSKLQLPTSDNQVVCVSPEVIRCVLGLLQHPVKGAAPVLVEVAVTLGVSTTELVAQVVRVVNSETALRELCEEPRDLEKLCKDLSEGFRSGLVATFLTATRIFEASSADDKPAFMLVSDAISTGCYVFHQMLLSYQSKLDVREAVLALQEELRQISETKVAQEKRASDIVGQLVGLKQQISAKSAELEQLQADLRQKIDLPKRLPVKICNLELTSDYFLRAKVQHLKALPKTYQIAYFPPCTTIGACALNCTDSEQIVEIAPLSSFRPGDYEVFLHKSGNPSVVKSNRMSFSVDLPEGSTPMG